MGSGGGEVGGAPEISEVMIGRLEESQQALDYLMIYYRRRKK
jgi:hypothetical protein